MVHSYARDSPSFPRQPSFFPAKVSYRDRRYHAEKNGMICIRKRALRIAEEQRYARQVYAIVSAGAPRRYQSRPLHAERILETQAVISSKCLTESERLLTTLRLRGSFTPFLPLPLLRLRFAFLFAPLGNVRIALPFTVSFFAPAARTAVFLLIVSN